MGARRRHPGHIRKRGKTHQVVLTVAGRRHRFTVPTTDRSEAEQVAKARFAELERQLERERVGLPGLLPMSQLLGRFESERLPLLVKSTQRAYLGSLERFRQYFVDELQDPTVDRIRPGHVRDFLSWRRVRRGGRTSRAGCEVRPVSNRTLEKDRATLHAVFALAEELEIRDGNPVSKVRRPKTDPRDPILLTDQQYEELLAACRGHPMLYLYVLTLGETGARCESEVLHLRWEDVPLADKFLKIGSGRDGHRTKSGRARSVPMTAVLKEAMREHQATYRMVQYDGLGRTKWVFHHLVTRRRAQAGDRIVSLRNGFKAAVKRAGLPGTLHQHDLRHRRITKWLAEGKNPVHVKEAVGHADLRTTMSYTHLAREQLI